MHQYQGLPRLCSAFPGGGLQIKRRKSFLHSAKYFFTSPFRFQACLGGRRNKKTGLLPGFFFFLSGGERGIRTPGTSQFNGFQDRRNRPLCHLSFGLGCKDIYFFGTSKNIYCKLECSYGIDIAENYIYLSMEYIFISKDLINLTTNHIPYKT